VYAYADRSVQFVRPRRSGVSGAKETVQNGRQIRDGRLVGRRQLRQSQRSPGLGDARTPRGQNIEKEKA